MYTQYSIDGRNEKKMKVAMITMHRVTNYGSVLQAYALCRKLKDIGFDVEIVDYYPERQTVRGLMRRIEEKINKPYPIILFCQAIMLPSYLKRYITFRQFRKKYFVMTRRYRTVKELEKSVPEADIYCTGSDQVWNYVESECVDGAYYWSFLPNGKKRFSYAASIGLTCLERDKSILIRGYLEKYKWISVREKSSVSLIRDMGITHVAHVADPVFLLEVDEWIRMSAPVHLNNYMLVYNIHRSREIDRIVQKLAKQMNLKLVYVGYAYHEQLKKGWYYCAPPVEKFLGLVKNASYVVSDSFHATVFAILFNKQFSVFTPPRYSVRIVNLLNEFGLEKRLFDMETGFAFAMEKVDYQKVNQKLKEKRQESIQLLECHLREIANDCL